MTRTETEERAIGQGYEGLVWIGECLCGIRGRNGAYLVWVRLESEPFPIQWLQEKDAAADTLRKLRWQQPQPIRYTMPP